MFETIAFYFFSVLSLAFFGISVFSKNTLYAMSSLAAGMIFISGLFFILNAEFLGVVQIMVYCGAVMILYGFSIMFFDASRNVKEKSSKIVLALAILSTILLIIILAVPISTDVIKKDSLENTQVIGLALFQEYLVAFELAAIMLLVAMICGIVLAHKNMEKSLTLEEEDK